MKLSDIEVLGQYKILDVWLITLTDIEASELLFLGLYRGETITLLNTDSSGCSIVVKDYCYNISKKLASCIVVEIVKEKKYESNSIM